MGIMPRARLRHRRRFDSVGGPAQNHGKALPHPGQLPKPRRAPGVARPLVLALLARVEEGEDLRRILVFFVKPLGLTGLHTCHDASILGNVSPGVGAPQRVDIPGRVIDWVQHGHAAPVTDPDLDQGATAPLRVVMPDMIQAHDPHDRGTDFTAIKPVFGR
jgi:hypothetical protein